jgi:hypothetical protein
MKAHANDIQSQGFCTHQEANGCLWMSSKFRRKGVGGRWVGSETPQNQLAFWEQLVDLVKLSLIIECHSIHANIFLAKSMSDGFLHGLAKIILAVGIP